MALLHTQPQVFYQPNGDGAPAGTESGGGDFERELKSEGKGAAEALLQYVCPWDTRAGESCSLQRGFWKQEFNFHCLWLSSVGASRH